MPRRRASPVRCRVLAGMRRRLAAKRRRLARRFGRGERLLTTKQAAHLAGLHPVYLLALRPPSLLLAHRRYYRRAALLAWLTRHLLKRYRRGK